MQAASVLLARGPGSTEVFLVRRGDALRFFGGFLAFPGGKVAPGDELLAAPSAEDAATRAARVAVARELFEETGVLLARRPDGTFPPSGPDLDRLRETLLKGGLPFAEVLSELRLKLEAHDLVPIGLLTTPAFAAQRFATTFFVSHQPANQEARVWPGELSEGSWSTAAGLVERWTRGECVVTPPTIMMLQALRGRPLDEAPGLLGPELEALAAGAMHPIYFAPEVRLIPLRTQALPPSTHTNAYLVGRDPAYLIDPGSPFPEEQQQLFEVLDRHRADGLKLAAVVLTHHHPDHVGAAVASADRYGLPIWSHAQTADALGGEIPVARRLQDGERLDLGTAPDGTRPWYLEAVYTPGHAPGHLAFHEPHYGLLFAGDMVSTMTSVVVGPPDGDLAVYLESLRRLRTYPCRLLLPSHGNASANPHRTIDEALEHRALREEQLVQALEAGPRRIADLAVDMYRGLHASMMRFAEAQILAGLQKLQREGRAEELADGRWRLRALAA
jgi:glyoxylase-like metal-dependent hydrolase (beta-lactamase superfamily II)/8-oxo-dGTP pyrophosphatase MutT (NUDIX family)